ncbi:hypothetical protein L211DRAFT_145726 [Terfezia boudieri ATCC MYA-4762]|uniref:Uncharacterized protein n=1 Tax=Terfezia boudieri ATCC MYA-4762 TaxID=1051890 RepID=A0A3N4LSU0_9PEZI|nr:hypothetical protein L211DRAFT_145726 [Terfezia boudieri ATCC MYA-4762]
MDAGGNCCDLWHFPIVTCSFAAASVNVAFTCSCLCLSQLGTVPHRCISGSYIEHFQTKASPCRLETVELEFQFRVPYRFLKINALFRSSLHLNQ